MADVAIIHAADKGTAAARLAEAVAGAGFSVGAVEIGDPAGLADSLEGCESDARILIWSRPLVSHALHSGDLTRIRQLRGLIEVSADGITPPSRGDDNRVVSISGWRGQPFHPGWQRIHVELKRLCGSRKAPAEAPPVPAVAKKPPPERTAPAASTGAARPRARRLMLGAGAAALLAAAAVGAASWLGQGAPDSAPRQELREPLPPAATAGASRPGLAPEPGAAGAPMTGPPAASNPPSPPSSEVPPAARAEPKAPGRAGSDEPRPRPAARPKQQSSPPAGPVKKYSRKNSKVMRQFCERSGRSTPQCRTFLRSVGEADGSRD